MSAVRPVYAARLLLGLGMALAAGTGLAASDPFIDVLPNGGAAVGYLLRYERPTYREASHGPDHLPLYLYEGEHAYM